MIPDELREKLEKEKEAKKRSFRASFRGHKAIWYFYQDLTDPFTEYPEPDNHAFFRLKTKRKDRWDEVKVTQDFKHFLATCKEVRPGSDEMISIYQNRLAEGEPLFQDNDFEAMPPPQIAERAALTLKALKHLQDQVAAMITE